MQADGSSADVSHSQPDSELLPNYNDVCEQQCSQTNEDTTEGFTPVHLLGPSVIPSLKVDPTYQEVVELPDTNSAPTGHVELVTVSTPPLPVRSGRDSAPIPGPIYQEVAELPQRRTPVNESDNQDNRVTEVHEEHDSEVRQTPVQATASDLTDTAPYPLYQEVANATSIQDGVPTDSNLIADNNGLIELSDMWDLPAIGDDIEHVESRLSPSQFDGSSSSPFGGIYPINRLYDEVTERPRVISPANFADATNTSPQPTLHTSAVQSTSPTPPNSSPIPAYASVIPRSARSKGTVDRLEIQPEPKRDSPEFIHTSQTQNFTPPPSSLSPIPAYATVTPPSIRARRTLDQPPQSENDSLEVLRASHAQNSTPPLPDSSSIVPYASVTPPSGRSGRTVDLLDQPPQVVDNDSSHASHSQNSTPPPPGSSPLPTYATVIPRSARSRGQVEQSPDVHHSLNNSPEPLHTPHFQNSTPPPPDSSPLPAYTAVAPCSARSRGAEDVVEQPPKLELASSTSFQPYPHSPPYNFADSRYLPPADSFLDEWDDYKIPPGGTLV